MRKPLGTISLMLLTVGSVDSIRNLPTAALAANEIIFYFTVAALLFLLPCTIVCAWFHRYSDQGIYGWIKTGLGARSASAGKCIYWSML